ncbi:tubulin epsilon and delta complex protein 1 [Chanos chanos]|uniref:Tubulin epsilon and delta complex protein 1 n=1 Tax=Chanos chanos TaxID=29144 RepID=A0A6J2WG21_CHACN|nr:tubulin epsilon and delta complex protein 1 [Chanos chanos]
MRHAKSVKVKEVITALCKLLSALGIDSVPSAESFRRAKFNQADVTEELWKFLHSILMKVCVMECTYQDSAQSNLDSQSLFVRSALWHCGYGAEWVLEPKAGSLRVCVGSRDLLLAFGWILSSGNPLEFLLEEKAQQLERLSRSALDHMHLLGDGDSQVDVSGTGEGGSKPINGEMQLRTLQWQYGKLKLHWRRLLAAQEERSRLTHRILSSPAPLPETSSTDSSHKTCSTALHKELEQIQSLNATLEAYLNWKSLEPLFWSWMDSVIDNDVSRLDEDAVADVSQRDQGIKRSCSHAEKSREAVKQLNEMVQLLEAELRLGQTQQPDHSLSTQGRHQAQHLTSDRERTEVERRVTTRLQGLRLTNGRYPLPSRAYIPCLQDSQPAYSAHKPQKVESGQVRLTGKLQALDVLRDLKEREALLQWKLELLRQTQREELQDHASTLEGLVLIPPLKR